VHYDLVSQNRRRAILLMVLFAGLVLLVSWAIAQLSGLNGLSFVAIGAIIAMCVVAVSYWYSDRLVMAVSHARIAERSEFQRYHNLVEGLCLAAGMPKPTLYVVEDPAPNAFATGRNPKNASIAVTTGLLEQMERVELEAVLAHELSHIKHYDTLVSTSVVLLTSLLVLVSDVTLRAGQWGGIRHRNDQNPSRGPQQGFAVIGAVLLILAPVAARLLQFSLSRRREYMADAGAIEMTRYPPGLIRALKQLEDDKSVVHSGARSTSHLWIESPVPRNSGRTAGLNRLFDTHPPLEERIAVLERL
jgi:heat shock protein HtpX